MSADSSNRDCRGNKDTNGRADRLSRKQRNDAEILADGQTAGRTQRDMGREKKKRGDRLFVLLRSSLLVWTENEN